MKKSFVEELKWRGMIHDLTPGLEEKLNTGMVTGYIGFDPTAPSMTIGNYLQIMILKLFQLCGHKPIVLMGGATGRIGDPSGKDEERELKSYDELDRNLAHQKEQVKRLLDFNDQPNSAVLLNNLDFYKDMNALTFLRDVGKHITVNYMLSKESVKRRMDTGISYTEFSYQLLQAYDFLHLFREEGCVLQMGGSDQWGNITSGTEFIRRAEPGSEAFALTTPLLTKADGKKFGKSDEGNIWLDPDMTAPYKFYQFWLNVDDKDLPKLFRFFSLFSKKEIEIMESDFGKEPNTMKAILGEEMTIRIHGEEAYQAAHKVSNILFNPKADKEHLLMLNQENLELISQEIPSFKIGKNLLANGMNVLDLLSDKTSICSSKSDARRAIESNSISMNKEKIVDIAALVKPENLLHNRFAMIEHGKKNKYIIEFV